MASISWQEIIFLQSINRPATYLKMMMDIWGIEVKSIAEIGVFQGGTSKLFRALFPDAFLYLVDPWQIYDEYLINDAGPVSLKAEDYEACYQMVKEAFEHDSKVKIIRKTSQEAVNDVPLVDLVFIDANHSYSYVKQDLELWYPRVKKGGILSGHDYDRILFPGVIKAVDEFFPEGVVLGQDTTWLKQKL
jgi:hypothetical protein